MSCTDAIAEVFASEKGVLSTRQVIERIYSKCPDRRWKEVTIRSHLVGLSKNHPSGHFYPTSHKRAFLFSLGDGRYRLWDAQQDSAEGLDEPGAQPGVLGEEREIAEGMEELHAAPADTSLSLERDLERSLLLDLEQLEPGLRVYHREGVSGQQMDTGVVGRLDILAEDANDDLVVTELKAGSVDWRVSGQILRYMGWVQERLAGERKVRGIIVRTNPSHRLPPSTQASTACGRGRPLAATPPLPDRASTGR